MKNNPIIASMPIHDLTSPSFLAFSGYLRDNKLKWITGSFNSIDYISTSVFPVYEEIEPDEQDLVMLAKIDAKKERHYTSLQECLKLLEIDEDELRNNTGR